MSYRHALTEWLSDMDWDVAGTLTFVDGITEKQADHTMRMFKYRLNRSLYNNQAKDGKRGVDIAMFKHIGAGDNIHYHFAALTPSDRFANINDFLGRMEEIWRKVRGANLVSEFKPITNKIGWIDYMAHPIDSKQGDAFNIHSSRLPIKKAR